MTRKSLFAIATLLGVFAACGEDDPSGPPDSNTVTITVADDEFQPPTRTVEVGATVRWNTTGSNGHNVTFDDGPDSGTLSQGDEFERTFSQAGTYEYVCTFHEGSGMTGTIVVQ